MQIKFSNGVETEPISITDDKFKDRDKISLIDLDPRKRISKISFGLSICDSIIAIRCYDEFNEQLVDFNWWDKKGFDPNIELCLEGSYTADLKEWQTREL